jgi:tetratricopeptide (TPR) repeat protein
MTHGQPPAIARTLDLLKRGALAEAKAEARTALAADPDDPALLHLAGMVAVVAQDFALGESCFRAALEKDGGDISARINLARALLALGGLAEAEDLCREPAGAPAADAELLKMRAYIFQETGRASEAASAYAAVVERQPADFESWNNLGNARRAAGDTAGAVAALDQARRLRPDLAIVHHNHAAALAAAGRLEDSLRSSREAVRRAPGEPAFRLELGRALGRLDRSAEAAAVLKDAARLAPRDVAIRVEIGNALAASGRFEEAERAYRGAIALQPDLASSYLQLALLLESQGRSDELQSLLDEAQAAGVERDRLALAWALALRRQGKSAEALAAAEAAPADFEPHRRAQLIGELSERLGDFPAAFRAFQEMNSEAAPPSSPHRADAARYRSEVAAMTPIVTETFYAGWTRHAPPDERPPPVFLLGFPRSGTTLLDTVLMGHPQVEVVEEQPLLRPVVDAAGDVSRLAGMSPSEVSEARRSYWRALDEAAPDAAGKLVIDKMPLNGTLAPYIHRIFPDARFIFAERHPCDVVLSCFATNFRLNPAMASFLDIEDAARLYDIVMDLWTRSRRVFGLNVHALRYERLVEDPEAELRPLIEFLGLEWDPVLLDHSRTAKSRGYISTASYAQVTQPLYKRARGRWLNYRQEMEQVLPLLLPWARHFGYEA